jgi:hypothetical protein
MQLGTSSQTTSDRPTARSKTSRSGGRQSDDATGQGSLGDSDDLSGADDTMDADFEEANPVKRGECIHSLARRMPCTSKIVAGLDDESSSRQDAGLP